MNAANMRVWWSSSHSTTHYTHHSNAECINAEKENEWVSERCKLATPHGVSVAHPWLANRCFASMSEAKIILTDVFVEKYDNLKKQNKQYKYNPGVCAHILRACNCASHSLALTLCFCCRYRLLAHSLLLFKLIIYLRTKKIRSIFYIYFSD